MQCHGWRIVGLIGGLVLSNSPIEILARERYLQEFQAKYEKFFAGNDEATKCTVCHPGLIKRSRNPYGQAVHKILTGRNVRDVEQIREALLKVEKEPSEIPGKTFGDLIEAGVLPGSRKTP